MGFYETYPAPVLVLRNNIFTANGVGLFIHLYLFGDPTIEHNLVFGNGQDWGEYVPPASTGNLAVDPLLVDLPARDLRLQPGSPAVDAGLSDGAPDHDFAGLPRPLDGNGDGIPVVDVGAYELPPAGFPTYTPTSTPTERPTTAPTPTSSEPSSFGPFPPGTTIFVDAANSGSTDGSPQHPFRSIQAGIDSASDAAIVGVAAGTYKETFIMQRRVDVRGSGAATTVIDAGGLVPAVRCADQSTLEGFTITNAAGRNAAAVECGPQVETTIAHNRITGNDSVGVRAYQATVVILDNDIDATPEFTAYCPCDAVVLNQSDATVRANRINADDQNGNVSAVDASGYHFTITQNRIAGRLFLGVDPAPQLAPNQVANNLIVTANGFSEGINLAFSPDAGLITNNTLVGGSGIFLQGGSAATIANNVVAFGVQGIIASAAPGLVLRSNLVFGNSRFGQDTNYIGVPDPTGTDGNLSADPLFVDRSAGNFHLSCRSPAVDAGDAASAPRVDGDGDARPFDAHGNGVALPDIGADEYVAARPAATFRVPEDFATPREAIEQSLPCDVVVVARGTYAGSVRFDGKDVDLSSVGSAADTAIEGTGGPVVDIGPGGQLRGFTVRNRVDPSGVGAAVHGSGAHLHENIFDGRTAYFSGILAASSATPHIERNVLRGNGCPAGDGVIDLGSSSALVESNLIVDNQCGAIVGNGRLARVVNNTLVHNHVGIDWSAVPQTVPMALNNIIAGNDVGLVVSDVSGPDQRWQSNLLFANGQNYVGIDDQAGSIGNLQDDPRFIDMTAGDYHLRADSPAIDAGLTAVAPERDLDGAGRPLDGNGDGMAVVDIGAYEFGAVTACPGDCDGNHRVTINELISGVNIALANVSLSICEAFDIRADGMLTIDELIRAVSAALLGC